MEGTLKIIIEELRTRAGRRSGTLASKHIVCTPLSFANRRFIFLFTTSSSLIAIVSFSFLKLLELKFSAVSFYNTNQYHYIKRLFLCRLVWFYIPC